MMKATVEDCRINEDMSGEVPGVDSVRLEQIEATVEEAGQNRQEDCRVYEDMSGAVPGADSVPLDQVTRTVAEAVPSDQIKAAVEEAGQYEQLDIVQDKEEYDDVKVYQRLKV